MSAFNASLSSVETYALTVSPLDSFVGELSLQAQLDNYAGGNTITFDEPVPEPATILLMGFGALTLRRRKA